MQMPTLGAPPKKSPFGKVVAIAVAIGALAGGVYWWRSKAAPAPVTRAPSSAPAEVAAVAPALPVAPPTPEQVRQQAGLRLASVQIDGPLETALIAAVGKPLGAPLTQVVTRSLVWWVEVPGDLRRGDRLEVLFEERAGEEPVAHAVRFTSGKFEKVFQAYRFKADGDPFARFYQPSGEELEQRLEDPPLEHYEQVTSLLRDGRRHKGVDFKAPVGTPVKAPFAGTITRKNWSFRGNGNCVELSESGGLHRKAFFLHLSELPRSLQVGQRVGRGQVLAQSGNSGHSFAPHLHYQLMGGGDRVLDPFVSQKVFRKSLAEAQRPALAAEILRLGALISPPTVVTPQVAGN